MAVTEQVSPTRLILSRSKDANKSCPCSQNTLRMPVVRQAHHERDMGATINAYIYQSSNQYLNSSRTGLKMSNATAFTSWALA